MLTALLVSMVACMPHRPPPPPVVTVRCEGADQVRRDAAGNPLSRIRNACTQVRCEGMDFVRRDLNGAVVERRIQQCRPADPAPVRLTNQPGWKFGLSGRG